MNKRKFILVIAFSLIGVLGLGQLCFGQAGALRDYVGLITIHYHPDVITLMTRSKENWEKSGHPEVARSIDNYLKGISGTGFVYVADDGTNYILTNDHVIAQSDSLSITFEKQDGARTTYDYLKVLYVDEERDLAILVFDSGVKPFTEGLSFSSKPVDEGGDVFAAGFPGIANTAIWQFSRGNVSNSAVRLPKDPDSNEMIGPFIQHTAQVDPGNSGGPLLVAAEGVPTGYAVTGINTLSARWRQAANYAIPINLVQDFINSALSKEPVNERQLVTSRVNDFLGGIKSSGDLYNHISGFLSNSCTASNAEFAIIELLEKGTHRVIEAIDEIFIEDPVQGMSAAVGWTIETSMRARNGSVNVSMDSINQNDKGGFTVSFNVNGSIVQSDWVKEYGVYRLDTFGDVATGDKDRVAAKQAQWERDSALNMNYFFAVSAAFVYNFEYGAAFNASIKISYPTNYGIDVFFGENGYWQVAMTLGLVIPIRIGNIAIAPYGDLGFGIIGDNALKKKVEKEDFGFPFEFNFNLRGGIMVTTSYIPGLFARVFYQHNIIFLGDVKSHGLIGFGVGYGF